MPIEFRCKNCQKRLRCPDSAAGTQARCPQCHEINSVPLVSDSAVNPFDAPIAPSSIQPPPFTPPPFSPAGMAAAPPQFLGGAPQEPPVFGGSNPTAPPDNSSPPPFADQSGLASSLGVMSIIVGALSLTLGCCCAPVAAFSSIAALGMGIWGWSVAAGQLKQTRYAPFLRHLEPPAQTAKILSIVGVFISSLATLLYGGIGIMIAISHFMN